MPELPDVEGFRRDLASRLPNRRILSVHALDPSILRNSSPQQLGRALVGKRFARPWRHGKWLILPLSGGPSLLVHSGMTGHPYYASHEQSERHDRLVIQLDRGRFRYADQRKLRGIWLWPASGGIPNQGQSIDEITGPHGPDALEADRDTFLARLQGRDRGRLKSTLTDQSVIAGVGNLLADEICWQVRLRPDHDLARMDDAQLRQLVSTARRVLRTSARHGRVPPLRRWLTRVRDEHEPHCPRCGTELDHDRIGGRSTVWCPRCQPD